MYLRIAGAVAVVAALTACAGPGPGSVPAAPRPAGAVAAPAAGRPVDAAARSIAPIDPTRNIDCTRNAATGGPATVAVAMPGASGYTAAGTAQWHTSTFGTCAGYAWVELRLNLTTVRASDVCKQFDCALSFGLSVPGVTVGIVGFRVVVDAGSAVIRSTALQTYGGAAWVTGETYAQEFKPDRIYFSK